MIFLTVAAVIFLVFGFVVFFGAPYVPSHRAETKAAFDELYTLSAKDTLVDVGSGDGIVLRLAADRGARAVGYELNPLLVYISRILSRNHKNITAKTSNFWYQDLPADTTIVYAFSVTRDAKRMVKKMQHEADRLGKPLHVMTYGSRLPGVAVTKSRRAHFLYVFHPLHSGKA